MGGGLEERTTHVPAMKPKPQRPFRWLCPTCGTNHGFATMRRGRSYARQSKYLDRRQDRPVRVYWPLVQTSRRGPFSGHLRPVGLCPDPFHQQLRERFAAAAAARAGDLEPEPARLASAPDPEGAAERRRAKAYRHRAAQSKNRR